jgi:3-oxoacyl-[acyl-carrier protein] reductase
VDLGLKSRVAMIAASSKGLGRAVALELAKEGARIAMCSRHRDQVRLAAESIHTETGAEVYYEQCDVTRPEQVHSFVGNILSRFGNIHILITNAGGPPSGLFAGLRPPDWSAAFQLNLMSVIHLCAEVIPHMQRNLWGRIINITSISVKQPIDGLMLSNSIRSAVIGFAKTLSNEMAPYNILVNNVCPGYTRTERVEELSAAMAAKKGLSKESIVAAWEETIPLGRLGYPYELAALVAFLASERASYITGTTIPVDGGAVKSVL